MVSNIIKEENKMHFCKKRVLGELDGLNAKKNKNMKRSTESYLGTANAHINYL